MLHRAPSGRWERRPVLDRKPVALHGPSWLHQLWFAPLGPIVLGAVALLVAWRRHGFWRGVAALAVSTVGAVGLLIFGVALQFMRVDYTIYGPGLAVLCAGVFAGALVVALLGRRAQPDEMRA